MGNELGKNYGKYFNEKLPGSATARIIHHEFLLVGFSVRPFPGMNSEERTARNHTSRWCQRPAKHLERKFGNRRRRTQQVVGRRLTAKRTALPFAMNPKKIRSRYTRLRILNSNSTANHCSPGVPTPPLTT
jgi:hypothetical protein